MSARGHDLVTVPTPYGDLVVNRRVAQGWHLSGLPDEATLKRIAAQQAAVRVREDHRG